MEFHLPALTRYLVETGAALPRAGPEEQEAGSPRDAPPVPRPSDVTRLLAEQLSSTSAPPRLPKAVEAYFVGPAARGYQPIDADAQYVVPFNKPPPPRPPLETPPDADPNGDHTAKPVGPRSPPLARGPPRHTSLQTGQVASVVSAAVDTSPLDWSFLFGSPPPTSPQRSRGDKDRDRDRTSSLSASVATAIRPAKLGSSSTVGDLATGAAADKAGGGAAGLPPAARKGSLTLSSVQLRRQINGTESGGSVLLARRLMNPSVAAMPQTPEAKFCSAVMNVMERLAATQSIQTGRYRSLRLQAAEHREAIISTVAMPPPPKTGAFSSKAAANRMTAVLQRSGASLDDMQAIVKQIQQFKGLSDDLRTAVAQQFQLFCYPPGSYLYEQDCLCDEAFVLISGTVMLHAEGRPPHRLQAGTVLGVELMLRRQAVPLSVTTDPHFEAQLAVLSWSSYESTVRRWAAEKVTALLPELQASQVARLQAGLMRGISYAQRQPGEALYVGGQPTEHMVLLVQGQVLMAAPLEANTLVTQPQMVSQLRVMIGPLAASMVLNEMPRAQLPTRGGLRGGLKSGLARTSLAAPSGSSVRLSGDSGGEGAGGGPPPAAPVAPAGAASGRHALPAGGLRRRRGSGGGVVPLAAAAALAKEIAAAGPGSGSPAGGGSSDARVSGEGENAPADGPQSSAADRASGGDDDDGTAAAAPPSDGGPAGALQQRRFGSLRLSGSRGGSRNSRREPGGTEEGTAAAGATPAFPLLPLASEDSEPSISSTTGERTLPGEADAAAAASGSGETEREDPMESSAAAASRLSRVNLRFADHADATAAGAGSADATVAGDAVAPADASGEDAPSAGATAAGATEAALPDPGVDPVGYRPSSLPPGGGVAPEASLLPVVSAFDLAVDGATVGGSSGGAGPGWEPLSPVRASRGNASNSSVGPEPSFALTAAGAGVGAGQRSGGGFAFAEAGADGDGGYDSEPATPALLRPPSTVGKPSSSPLSRPTATATAQQPDGSGPPEAAEGGEEALPQATAAEPSTESSVTAPMSEGGVSGGGSGDGSGSGNPGVSASSPDPDSAPTQPDNSGGIAARDSADGGSAGAESRPPAAALAPTRSPSPSAAPSSGTPPLAKGGLRTKISGVSDKQLLQTQASGGGRGASRGASPHASGTSTPRSVSVVSRGDSVNRMALSPASGAGGTATGGSTSPLRNATPARISVVTPLEGGSSVGGNGGGGGGGGRGSMRPVLSLALAEGAGRVRRPSSPMSEAPSVDERRYDSASTVIVHPTLPPADPAKLQGEDGGDPGQGQAEQDPQLEQASLPVTSSIASVPSVASDRAGAGGRTRRGRRGSATGRRSSGSGAGSGPPPPSGGTSPRSPRASGGSKSPRLSAEELPQPPEPSALVAAAEAAAAQPSTRLSGELATAVAAALPPPPAPPELTPSQPPRVPANAILARAAEPDPDIDYSVARVGGAALPGTGPAKPRHADARPVRAVGLERANLHPGARHGGGGGGGAGAAAAARRSTEVSGRSSSFSGGSPGPAGAAAAAAGAAAAGTGASQPLANALATQCKLHQHRVQAVYGGPVVFCEEALSERKDGDSMKATKPPTAHSAVALQRCEYILIPAALLRSLLPAEQLPALAEAAVAAQRRLVTASGHVEDSGPVTWPAAADKIRHILSTSTPGHRQPWQVELLASAFSHLPAFSRLTWQVRLRVFQDLEYRKLEAGDTLELARLIVTEQQPPAATPHTPQKPPRSSDASGAQSQPQSRKSSTTSLQAAEGGGSGGGEAAEEDAPAGAAVPEDPQQQSGPPRTSEAQSSLPSVGPSRNVSASGALGAVDGGPSGSPSGSPRSRSLSPRSLSGKLPWAVKYGSRRGAAAMNADAGAAASSPLSSTVSAPAAIDVAAPASGVTDDAVAALPSPRTAEAAAEAAVSAVAVAAAEGEELAAVASMAQMALSALAAAAGRPGSATEAAEAEADGEAAEAATASSAAAEEAPRGPSSRGSTPRGAEAEADAGRAPTPSVPSASSRSSSSRAPSAATGPAGSGAESLPGEAAANATAAAAVAATDTDGAAGSGNASAGDAPPEALQRPSSSSPSTSPRAPRRRSQPQEHTVEALFNPAEEEPLIPSLALRQRRRSGSAGSATDQTRAADGEAGAGDGESDGATPFGAAAAVALVASGSPSAEGSVAVMLPAATEKDQAGGAVVSAGSGDSPDPLHQGGGGGAGAVEFPVVVVTDLRAESPTLLPRGASLDREPDPDQEERVSTAGTLDSGPPSVSPYSLNSLPITPYDSSSRVAAAADSAASGSGRASHTLAAEASGAGSASAGGGGGGGGAAAVAKPVRREAVAEKLDDRSYWCLSGCLVLEAALLPADADTNPAATAEASTASALPHQPPTALGPERSGSSLRSAQGPVVGGPARSLRSGPQGAHERGPRQLQVAKPGDAFSGGALAEAATAAFTAATPRPTSQQGQGERATPPATPSGQLLQTAPWPQPQQQQQPSTPPPELQQQLVQALPLGCSVLRARVVAGAGAEPASSAGAGAGAAGGATSSSTSSGSGAEVLCMSRTMFELLSNGIGRSVPPAVLPVLARHVDWLGGVDLQSLAADLSGHYRLEEHKQGTELLRAGEAAPVVFLVAAGECVMRGPVVGLREPGSVADQLDLATLREGATCGELSLLAARPLWYTLVVSSVSAKVVSLDMPALRSWLLSSPTGRSAAADVVAAVAEVDVALYGRAVKQIAVQVMSEKLDMSLFNVPMKKILRRVIEDNGPELSASLEREREREREREQQLKQQQQEAGKGKPGRDSSTSGGTGTGVGTGMGATGSTGPGTASSAAAAPKRPRDIVLEGWNQVEAIAASLARPYDPSAQSWELIAQARYNASRRQLTRYLDSLLASSQLTTLEDERGHPSGDQRIAMPAHGLAAEAMAEPGPVRHARQYDIRTVPKDLRGSEVESSRLSWDCSYVPLHELTTMMGAATHLKQSAAMQLLTMHATGREEGTRRSGSSSSNALTQPQQQEGKQEGEGQQAAGGAASQPPPPGCSAVVGASNYLIAHKAGGGGGGGSGAAPVAIPRLRTGGLKRPGATSTSTSTTPLPPSLPVGSSPPHRPSVTLVATAPWDAMGRLPGASGSGPVDASGSPSSAPLAPTSPGRGLAYRDNLDKPPSPSGWSLGPLDMLRGRSTANLSHAPSTSSMALLDPDLRAQLELNPDLDPMAFGLTGPSEPVSPARIRGGSPDPVRLMLSCSYDSPRVHLTRPLVPIPEESSTATSRSVDMGAPGEQGLGQGLDSPARAPVLPLGKSALPPLPPPHGSAVAAWPPSPVLANNGSPPGAAGCAAAGGGGGLNAKRSRIQGRAASPSSEATAQWEASAADDPARSFWVRDKLHDPQGLTGSVMTDAAARAVGRALATRGLLAAGTSDDGATAGCAAALRASSPGSSGASSLAGRGGARIGARSMRLQPLRRNGSGGVRSGAGASAAIAAAAAAAASGGGSSSLAARGGGSAPAALPAGVSLPPADPDMLYVTLQLPEAPKILPEFPSAAALREATEAAAAAERAAREARLAAAISHHSTRPLQIRPDMKYVPQYLRNRQRPPVVPPPARPLPEGTSESWVVPSYSSEVGFQDGFYDENSQVIYFD